VASVGDREISVTWLVSVAMWATGFGMIVVGMVIGNGGLGQLGLWHSAVGACLSVRGYILDLHYRERNAFELGRDSAELRGLP
jgi:hypothetical protein